MGLFGVECFLYISYILLNVWKMGECRPVALWKEDMSLVKSVFNFFYIKAEFICCKIDLKYPLAAEEVEIISFFFR